MRWMIGVSAFLSLAFLMGCKETGDTNKAALDSIDYQAKHRPEYDKQHGLPVTVWESCVYRVELFKVISEIKGEKAGRKTEHEEMFDTCLLESSEAAAELANIKFDKFILQDCFYPDSYKKTTNCIKAETLREQAIKRQKQ